MRSTAMLALGLCLLSGLPMVASLTACTDVDEVRAPVRPTSAVQPPAVQGRSDEPSSTQARIDSASGCEELGKLAGSSLTAVLTAHSQSIDLPLVNRPAPSRVAVAAVGPAADLVGKTVALGAAENANYQTCTRCLVIALGCSGDDCSKAAWFFPRSGLATLTAAATQPGERFDGRFEDVILDEVKIDWVTRTSTPLAGGACLHLQELSFDGTVTPAPGSSTSSSSSGGTGDDGGSGTGTSGGTGGGGGGGSNGAGETEEDDSSTTTSGGTGGNGGGAGVGQ